MVLNGIVRKLRTGSAWREVPERYGSWATLCNRFRRRAAAASSNGCCGPSSRSRVGRAQRYWIIRYRSSCGSGRCRSGSIRLECQPFSWGVHEAITVHYVMAPKWTIGQERQSRAGFADRLGHCERPGRMNRLAGVTSPYLLQHADNPVDWWPWTPEAFEEARRRDVPVLLLVGYSACHWCQ